MNSKRRAVLKFTALVSFMAGSGLLSEGRCRRMEIKRPSPRSPWTKS